MQMQDIQYSSAVVTFCGVLCVLLLIDNFKQLREACKNSGPITCFVFNVSHLFVLLITIGASLCE